MRGFYPTYRGVPKIITLPQPQPLFFCFYLISFWIRPLLSHSQGHLIQCPPTQVVLLPFVLPRGHHGPDLSTLHVPSEHHFCLLIKPMYDTSHAVRLTIGHYHSGTSLPLGFSGHPMRGGDNDGDRDLSDSVFVSSSHILSVKAS